MSSVEVNQVLAQMRAISATASYANRPSESQPGNQVEFSKLVEDSINQVNDTQRYANELNRAFQAGATDVALPQVVDALDKANQSFETMNQVRDKLLSAYQEIMNMKV